jgi:excisionase family DNA binding protein
LVDVEAVAEFLAVPKSWVYEQAKHYGLPTHRLGRYLRFDLNEVREWLAARRA